MIDKKTWSLFCVDLRLFISIKSILYIIRVIIKKMGWGALPALSSYFGNSYVAPAAAAVAANAAYNYMSGKGKKKMGTSLRRKRRNLTKPSRKRKSRLSKRRRSAVKRKLMQAPLKKERVSPADSTHLNILRDDVRCTTSSTANIAAYQVVSPITVSTIEAAMANLRYYDPANPATLITANASTGSYNRKILVQSQGRILLRNNYTQSVKCTIYICVPRMDTSIDPDTARTSGLTDQGNPSSSSPMLYPEQVNQFNYLWAIKETKTKILRPGQMISAKVPKQYFVYNCAYTDDHSLAYQRDHKAWTYYIRVEGLPVHDTAVSSQIGTGYATVEGIYETRMKFFYDAGVELNDISVTNNCFAVTGGTALQAEFDAALETYT